MLPSPEPNGPAAPQALHSIRGSIMTDTKEILDAVPTGVPLSTADRSPRP